MFVFLLLVTTVFADGTPNLGKAPWLELNDKRRIPVLGIGTWLGFSSEGGRVKPTGHEVEDAVKWAIDAGYRHIDTAFIYETEAQVGRAIQAKIAEGAVKREDLFVTTKLWNDQHARSAVVPALKASLKELGLDYVDLYLIHWPVPLHANGSLADTDYLDTWQGMMEARAQGLTRSIGVSNFNQHMMERILASAPVKPAVLQVELNLNLQQPRLLAFCRQQGVAVTGYTPLGSLLPSKASPDAPPPRVDHPALVAMATKYNKTVPQIALKYLTDLKVIPIPKSLTKSRIEENIDVFDFELTPTETKTLKSFDTNYRTIPVRNWIESPYYPFEK